MSRVRARVEGTVQGVGFRPYVYRLAGELGVAGHVLNDSRGVVVEVEAPAETVDRFLARLVADAPPLAHVERVVPEALEETGETGFAIRESPPGRRAATPPSRPTAATCPDCLAELFDPGRPPLSLPVHQLHELRAALHDRARRPVRPAEHDDGRLRDVRRLPARVRGPGRPPLPRPAERLPRLRPARCGLLPAAPQRRRWPPRSRRCSSGAIVAVKGVGGFHLACVAERRARRWPRLRARKHREDKPFALMAPDLVAARSARRARRRGRDAAAVRASGRSCSPRGGPTRRSPRRWRRRSRELGVMLPYSPLHHLLLADVGRPLVMTSGNVSDEPIAYRDDDALERLARDRRRLPAARPADRDAHRRLGRARGRAGARSRCGARAGTCRRRSRCPSRRPAAARLRRGAEEHVRPSPGAAARGSATTSATSRTTRRSARSPRASSTSSGCSRSSPAVVAHDLHPEYLSTKYAHRSRGRAPASACSTTTPTWRPASPSTARPGRRSARSSTARATAATARSGAASCCSAT